MRNMRRTPYTYRKDMLKELPPFDPTREDYTEFELGMYADQMLRDAGASDEAPFLFQEHIESRWRTERSTANGTPDPTLTKALSKDGQTMFKRQHPEGRKVNSKEQRKINGASYYR